MNHENPWDIEDIKIDIERTDFYRKFSFYVDSNLIQSSKFELMITNDFISEIKKSEIDTGIMISSMKINSILIYLFILDNKIFIIKHINNSNSQKYFNEHLNSLMFMTSECHKNFFKEISSKDHISELHDQILNEQKKYN